MKINLLTCRLSCCSPGSPSAPEIEHPCQKPIRPLPQQKRFCLNPRKRCWKRSPCSFHRARHLDEDIEATAKAAGASREAAKIVATITAAKFLRGGILWLLEQLHRRFRVSSGYRKLPRLGWPGMIHPERKPSPQGLTQ